MTWKTDKKKTLDNIVSAIKSQNSNTSHNTLSLFRYV